MTMQLLVLKKGLNLFLSHTKTPKWNQTFQSQYKTYKAYLLYFFAQHSFLSFGRRIHLFYGDVFPSIVVGFSPYQLLDHGVGMDI